MKVTHTVSIGLLTFSLLGASFSAAAPGKKSPISEDDSLSHKRDELIRIRVANQEKRIEAGQVSGLLKKAEAKSLRRELTRIDGMQNRAVADGKISPEEMEKVQQAIDEVTQNINSKIRAQAQKTF